MRTARAGALFAARLPLPTSDRRLPRVSLFVTFEGIEGCGKSTQAALLGERLRAAGRGAVVTREPGGTAVTGQIRRLLADPESKLDNRAELFLFFADRAQHVAEVIRPGLDRGDVVVCDRYADSTLAYQGYGRGHEIELLETWNKWASRDTRPDLTLWIDCDIDVGLGRARKQAGGPGDRFEAEPTAFHTRVRDGFAALAERDRGRIVRIDGNADLDTVAGDVWNTVEAKLP